MVVVVEKTVGVINIMLRNRAWLLVNIECDLIQDIKKQC